MGALVSTDWLAGILGRPDLVVFDDEASTGTSIDPMKRWMAAQNSWRALHPGGPGDSEFQKLCLGRGVTTSSRASPAAIGRTSSLRARFRSSWPRSCPTSQ